MSSSSLAVSEFSCSQARALFVSDGSAEVRIYDTVAQLVEQGKGVCLVGFVNRAFRSKLVVAVAECLSNQDSLVKRNLMGLEVSNGGMLKTYPLSKSDARGMVCKDVLVVSSLAEIDYILEVVVPILSHNDKLELYVFREDPFWASETMSKQKCTISSQELGEPTAFKANLPKKSGKMEE